MLLFDKRVHRLRLIPLEKQLLESRLLFQVEYYLKMIEMFSETLTCAEEELADVLIRVLDTSAVLKIDVERAVRIKMLYNRSRSTRHGGKIA